MRELSHNADLRRNGEDLSIPTLPRSICAAAGLVHSPAEMQSAVHGAIRMADRHRDRSGSAHLCHCFVLRKPGKIPNSLSGSLLQIDGGKP